MSENINTQANNDEISLRDLILKIKESVIFLLSKWKIIVIIGCLGGVLGLVCSLLLKPSYISKLSFALQEKSSGGGLASLAGQFGVSMGGGAEGLFSSANILEILKSRNLIEKTLLSPVIIDNKQTSLINHYIDFNEIEEDWRKKDLVISFPLNQNRHDFSRIQDSVLYILGKGITEKNLIVKNKVKESSIIDVKFTNDDEIFAKYFTEILVSIATQFYVDSKISVSTNNLVKMQLTADSVKTQYENLLIKRALTADRNQNPARQILGVSQQKDITDIQIMATAYAELMKNIELTKLDIARETPIIQIIDTPIFPLERDRLGKAMGIVIGGFLGGFFIVSFLIIRRVFQKIMAEE